MVPQACAPARRIHPFVTFCTTVQQSAGGQVCTRFRRHLYWRSGDCELTILGPYHRRRMLCYRRLGGWAPAAAAPVCEVLPAAAPAWEVVPTTTPEREAPPTAAPVLEVPP